MAKKLLSLILSLVLLLGLVALLQPGIAYAETETEAENEIEEVVWDGTEAEFRIGIVTGTVSQSEDDLRGAEELIKRYGAASEGGMIQHVTYPDNFMSEQETTISQIVGLADDDMVKAIVVNQAVPGTAAAFAEIREFRDDILLIACSCQEDPKVLAPVADLMVDPDNIARGYLIPYLAKELGADTFVHVSFPRHMSYEMLSRRRTIMEEACKDLGLEYHSITVPDPMSDIGIPGAQQFILENMDSWVQKYGKDTCFFATNDAQTEPLLKKVAELGAIFAEADLPSPLMGYPGAFDLDLKEEAGNWPAILKKVEESVIAAGGEGRMATWAYSFGFTGSAALGEYAKQVVEGTMEKGSFEDVLKALEIYTPGAGWKNSPYIDNSGEEEVVYDNYLLIYQDDYVFGKGFAGLTDVEVPEKYTRIKSVEYVEE